MISHELKNSLAILNENSGLLEDMLLMTKKGMPINIERLDKMSMDLNKQIDRSNLIITNMNSFAHSIDEPNHSISALASLKLFANISQRLASMNSFEIIVDDNFEDFTIVVNQFDLLNLMWMILDSMLGQIEKNDRLSITALSIDHKAILQFQCKNIASIANSIESNQELQKYKELVHASIENQSDKNIRVILHN
jgi:predicted O-linked N-acetylglucosamine transferase (SPINDLY family)